MLKICNHRNQFPLKLLTEMGLHIISFNLLFMSNIGFEYCGFSSNILDFSTLYLFFLLLEMGNRIFLQNSKIFKKFKKMVSQICFLCTVFWQNRGNVILKCTVWKHFVFVYWPDSNAWKYKLSRFSVLMILTIFGDNFEIFVQMCLRLILTWSKNQILGLNDKELVKRVFQKGAIWFFLKIEHMEKIPLRGSHY